MAGAALSKKDFKSDQDVRWCPGCGDYGILNAVQAAFAALGKDRSKTVIVSGIGCSSRFPYYMETYGFHTIHGRAPAIATGVKLANPDLDVWVVSGDGDSLSIGGNHLIHALRRNVGIKILLFNNRIYGLTKGQYSPTSELGKATKSSPLGSLDRPFHPVALALGAGATFVARSVDVFVPHLVETISRADAHEGSAIVEIYQNCNIFNDGAYRSFTEKELRDDRTLVLEHGKPLVFGKDRDRALVIGPDLQPQVTALGSGGVVAESLPGWDERSPSPAVATALGRMSEVEFPVPIGVFRAVERPVFERAVHAQIATAAEKKVQSLDELLNAGETWVVS